MYIQNVPQRFSVQKESVMKTVTTVQENAGDIYAEAQQINEDRKAQETSYADESQTEE